jgi:hypothetical protein
VLTHSELVALEKARWTRKPWRIRTRVPGLVLARPHGLCAVRLANVRISASAVTRRFQIDGIRLQLKPGRWPQGALDIVTAGTLARSTSLPLDDADDVLPRSACARRPPARSRSNESRCTECRRRVRGGCRRQVDGTAGLPSIPEMSSALGQLRLVPKPDHSRILPVSNDAVCGAPLSLHVNPRPADRSAARIDNPSGIAALSEPSNGSLDLARASRPPSRAPATI